MRAISRPAGGRDDADITGFSLGSCLPAALTSQDNALCTNLWIIPVKWLVNVGVAVDERGCGNVEKCTGAQSCQVAGLCGELEQVRA
jgi:hypothetical protein